MQVADVVPLNLLEEFGPAFAGLPGASGTGHRELRRGGQGRSSPPCAFSLVEEGWNAPPLGFFPQQISPNFAWPGCLNDLKPDVVTQNPCKLQTEQFPVTSIASVPTVLDFTQTHS